MRLARRADVPQSPERDHGLRPDAGRGVGQRREERAGLDAVELRLAVGQGPERELADGGVVGELPQGRRATRCRRAA